jgi:RNA polymerase sigma factor (sigma-70 family)
MLTEQEANELMNKWIDLKGQLKTSDDPKLIREFEKHEKLCVEKFRYLVTMKTGRYKAFSNYEDLNQEGHEALIKAMKTFKPNKGSFFAWAHNYIGTRISRSANLHTTIRFPLKVAKANTPHKESVMPLLIEERYCPDKELEESQVTQAVQDALAVLSPEQKEIINLAYGFDGDKPMSINKICKKLGISRLSCIKTINSALSTMKENIKL